MARLEWDKTVERLYETGIDRGVLYVPNDQGIYDNGFAWNGLTAIKENFAADNTKPHYFDGIKYLDSYYTGDFSATLSAFTYPDEFLDFEGVGSLGNGLYADDQNTKVFSLAYRTLVGNEVEGTSLGYQIHVLYNLTTVDPQATFQNGSELQPITFDWQIAGVPEKLRYYRPTSHIIIDSRYFPEDLLQTFEDIIYGSDDENPRLPPLSSIVGVVLGWDPRLIEPAPTTGLSPLLAGVGDLTETKTDGIYYGLPTRRLVPTEVAGLYELEIA